jgi:ABC-type transporter Mla maintaining outer membrane lipid asymmetry ATPase subunit MlaF
MLKDGEVYLEGTIDEFERSPDELIQSFFKTKKMPSHLTTIKLWITLLRLLKLD